MSTSAIQFDATAKASVKQLYRLGSHFAKLTGGTPQEVYGLSKRFPAALQRWQAEHEATPITMGDVSTFLSNTKVPAKFVKMVTDKKPTAKAEAAPKPKATPKPKASPAKTKAAPKPSEMPLGDFKDHFEKITGRVYRLEQASEEHGKRLATLDAKLDVIMAYITEEPDSE
tara:strand:+ start:651 stop:1163 length:513 start_codon:yes stop_codon:yes gene_type:complete